MKWYDAAREYAKRTWDHDGALSSLPEEWQRELVALERLSSDVMNGAYLQFLANHGRECYVYASRALKKIGATRSAATIDSCQALVDEHFQCDGKSSDELSQLMPNPIVGREGETIKEAGSVLPDSVLKRIYELSYEFMEFPDDFGTLAAAYFRPYLKGA